jgi:hypothetical protein
LVIELANANGSDRRRKRSRDVIEVPWRKTLSTRHREILLPESVQPKNARPIRSESRALLVASIARGRRWLDELITDPAATTESIAGREGCTTRKINMTISLAFLAPDLVKAAIDGRLPPGMGVARLADLSAEWSRQRQMLGLPVLQPNSPRRVVAPASHLTAGACHSCPIRSVASPISSLPAHDTQCREKGFEFGDLILVGDFHCFAHHAH